MEIGGIVGVAMVLDGDEPIERPVGIGAKDNFVCFEKLRRYVLLNGCRLSLSHPDKDPTTQCPCWIGPRFEVADHFGIRPFRDEGNALPLPVIGCPVIRARQITSVKTGPLAQASAAVRTYI